MNHGKPCKPAAEPVSQGSKVLPPRSAGLLLHHGKGKDLEVLLAHPGGPFWVKRDGGTWSIPKGLIEQNEEPLAAAIRETEEELGVRIEGDFVWLGEYRQPSGKVVFAWSVSMAEKIDTTAITGGKFEMEWPPKSGRIASFPEVDKAEWFGIDVAKAKILNGQLAMLLDLQRSLS